MDTLRYLQYACATFSQLAVPCRLMPADAAHPVDSLLFPLEPLEKLRPSADIVLSVFFAREDAPFSEPLGIRLLHIVAALGEIPPKKRVALQRFLGGVNARLPLGSFLLAEDGRLQYAHRLAIPEETAPEPFLRQLTACYTLLHAALLRLLSEIERRTAGG